MKNNKKTKKTFKPAYVVDITNCKDEFDVALHIAVAKQLAGYPISNDELETIIEDEIDAFTNNLAAVGVINKKNGIIEPRTQTIIAYKQLPKKERWYKRFWKWLSGRKD